VYQAISLRSRKLAIKNHDVYDWSELGGASAIELLQRLRAFGLANDRLDATVARRLGASPVEFKAMDHLHAAGELTPGQIGERLSLSSGAVTALLDRLERLGWVERAPHPTDRRSVIVRRKLVESEAPRIYAEFADEIARAARRLTPAEREACARFLDEAAAAAWRMTDELRATGSTGSGRAPTGSPAPGSPPTPAA
jgi:DNA-binding MarR family transcriptional regulator